MTNLKLIITFFFGFTAHIFSQSPTAIISLPKIYLPGDTIPGTSTALSNKEFGFEIWLVNTDTIQYAYNAGQYGVNLDSNIVNNGELTAEYVWSGLSASGKQPIAPDVRTLPLRVRLGANKFGDGGPFIQPGDSVNIATIKIINTVPWESIDCKYFKNLVLRSFNPDAVAVFIYEGNDFKANHGKAVILDIKRVTNVSCE